jgi:hypothetical protein
MAQTAARLPSTTRGSRSSILLPGLPHSGAPGWRAVKIEGSPTCPAAGQRVEGNAG